MRTIKCGLILSCCIGILLFSLIFVDWLILFFLIPLVLILFAGLLFLYDDKINLRVIRDVSNIKIFENDKIEINLKIKNLGEKIRFLEIIDELPDKVKITKGSNYAIINLDKDEEISIKYEIFCPIRGRYELGPILFRVRGFFGIFFKEAMVETSTDISIIPKVEDIGNIIMKAKPNIYPGIMQVKNAGIGTEFYGIRDYYSGDSFKRINWKSYARFNHLTVNEYELESTTDVILIVDGRQLQGMGSLKHNVLEYNIKAAISITSHFLKKRDRVGLICYGSSVGDINWIYPDCGKKQLHKIIEEIIILQPNGEFPFNGVVYQSINHLLPKKSLIIFISSLESDWSILKGLEQLIAYNHNVIIVSPSPIDIEYSLQKNDENNKLAYRILNFERNNYINQIRNLGVRVVNWNPTLPLTVSLKEVEKYQKRR